MITISDKSRVGVDALIELASRGAGPPVPILEVAERRGIAVHALEQVFGALRRAGILHSQRGVRGGYSLRRPAEQVTVLDVVEAVDGSLREAVPPGIWTDARAGLVVTLGGRSIADLAEEEARGASAPMFHI